MNDGGGYMYPITALSGFNGISNRSLQRSINRLSDEAAAGRAVHGFINATIQQGVQRLGMSLYHGVNNDFLNDTDI